MPVKFLSKDIKRYFDDNQIELFNSKDIYSLYSGVNEKLLRKALLEVVNLEYTQIEKGKYCRNTFSNEYAIGSFFSDDAVIAYWSALNIHGLTEQIPNKVFIQTSKKKENKEVFGIQYQFIKVHPRKITGFYNSGVGSNQFRITDVEKTMVDCFDLVQYSGGFMELIRAFYRTHLNSKKLITYSEAVGNKAAVKRMGFLAELFKKKGMKQFIKFAHKYKSKNYDLFDIQGYDEGSHTADWNLKLNMERNEIIDIAKSIY